MSHTRANILMLVASLIWGTAFVSQTTGMGAIGPFTFSFGRFFFAFLTVLPFAIYLERKNVSKILSDRKVPDDVIKFLDDEYYSVSKKQNIKFGDMDLLHYIRVNIKDHKNLWKSYNEVDDKLHKIQKIMEE